MCKWQRLLASAFCVGAAIAVIGSAWAAEYPTKPVELLCPFTAGGSTDLMARKVADIGSTYLGQPIVVVTKVGAGGSVAAAEVISARPDGYKIVTLSNVFFATTSKTQKLPFDPGDLVPLANFIEYRVGLAVRADSPWRTLQNLLDYGRKHPSQLKWAHAGRGMPPHLITAYVLKKTGVQAIDVAYKGTPEALVALLGGHVDALVVGSGGTMEQARAGTIRYVTFYSNRRYSDQQNVPSIADSGFPEAAKLTVYGGLFVHKNTPGGIKARLIDVCKKVQDDPRFKNLTDIGGDDLRPGGPEFVTESIKRAEEFATPILKEMGLYVEK